MSQNLILIDGMMSGTGVRDVINGGYLEPIDIGLSETLRHRIKNWLLNYELAHCNQYNDIKINEMLDQEGIAITKLARSELPNSIIGYFSNAYMREIKV